MQMVKYAYLHKQMPVYSFILQSKKILNFKILILTNVWWQSICGKGLSWTLTSSHLELSQPYGVKCSFCNATVTGCSLSQVYAHMVVTNVLGQKKINETFQQKYDDYRIKAHFLSCFGFNALAKRTAFGKVKIVE